MNAYAYSIPSCLLILRSLPSDGDERNLPRFSLRCAYSSLPFFALSVFAATLYSPISVLYLV
jgi:hypothetical protein